MDSIVKDFTEPIYSVVLIRNFDEEGNVKSFELSFSNKGEEHSLQFNSNSETIQSVSKKESITEVKEETNKLCLAITLGHTINIGIFDSWMLLNELSWINVMVIIKTNGITNNMVSPPKSRVRRKYSFFIDAHNLYMIS